MRNMIPCPSPRGTNVERLFLVRRPHLAMDAALEQQPDDPNNNNGAEQAYADLYQHLDGDTAALGLLKHLINCLTNDGASAMDEPLPYNVRPSQAQDAALRRRAAFRSGRAQAQQYLFDQKFKNASRIRVLG